MVAFAKKHRGRLIVLVEKTDRLYRNLRDWVTMDELDVEIHLVKEAVVLSPESRSHEKFMHGIKVLMAKNYVDNLSEETRKGMIEKAKQGIWPSFAPLGYRNILGPDGKRTIEPDPRIRPGHRAPLRTLCQRRRQYQSGRARRYGPSWTPAVHEPDSPHSAQADLHGRF
jgi:site-specific DNA recombinase